MGVQSWNACMRFQVLTAANMKITSFQDIAPCSLVEVDHLTLQSQVRICLEAGMYVFTLLWWCLVSLTFRFPTQILYTFLISHMLYAVGCLDFITVIIFYDYLSANYKIAYYEIFSILLFPSSFINVPFLCFERTVIVCLTKKRIQVLTAGASMKMIVFWDIAPSSLGKMAHISELVNCFSSSASIVSDYRLDDRGSIPDRGKGFFSLASVSRPALRPTQPPIQWVPGGGSFPEGKARPGPDADHSPNLVPRSRMGRSCMSSPLWRLHGGYGASLFYWFRTLCT
jgi:hypothetical protein